MACRRCVSTWVWRKVSSGTMALIRSTGQHGQKQSKYWKRSTTSLWKTMVPYSTHMRYFSSVRTMEIRCLHCKCSLKYLPDFASYWSNIYIAVLISSPVSNSFAVQAWRFYHLWQLSCGPWSFTGHSVTCQWCGPESDAQNYSQGYLPSSKDIQPWTAYEVNSWRVGPRQSRCQGWAMTERKPLMSLGSVDIWDVKMSYVSCKFLKIIRLKEEERLFFCPSI